MDLKTQVASAESNGENVSGSSSIAEQIDQKQMDKKRPTSAEIRRRAHEIYTERGGTDGCDLDDWLQAQRELRPNCKSNETRPKSN
jgi:hypothetical protein